MFRPLAFILVAYGHLKVGRHVKMTVQSLKGREGGGHLVQPAASHHQQHSILTLTVFCFGVNITSELSKCVESHVSERTS